MALDPSVLPIRDFLDGVPRDGLSEALLRRCLNEAWFSDTLAWLLDPRGSHGLGVTFLDAFVRCVAKKRSEDPRYARRATHLKFGKQGRGTGATSFSLANAAVLREFFLARGRGRQGRGPQYCDIVVLDLDSGDNFMMVVENKLFTVNRRGQLEGYLETVEDRYSRAHTREYVFLTLDGRPPTPYPGESAATYARWVCLSWSSDVLGILEQLVDRGAAEVAPVLAYLRWMRHLAVPDGGSALERGAVDTFLHHVLHASGERLLQELNRLGDRPDGWTVASENPPGCASPKVVLQHRSTTSGLYVEMLPNYSITAQTRSRRGARFEKIVVPFGAPPDQVFNLLDVGARDIYHGHFDKPAHHLGDHRRLRQRATVRGEAYLELFRFLYERRFELRVLLTSARSIWNAAYQEELLNEPEEPALSAV